MLEIPDAILTEDDWAEVEKTWEQTIGDREKLGVVLAAQADKTRAVTAWEIVDAMDDPEGWPAGDHAAIVRCATKLSFYLTAAGIERWEEEGR